VSRWTTRACQGLRERLGPIEVAARALPWADRAPWRAHRRITTERRVWGRGAPRDRVVRVDLHGLDGALARQACQRLRDALSEEALPLAYLRVVVGRGRHSTDGRRVLARTAAEELGDPPAPVRLRSSTVDSPDGHLDLVHPGRWRPHGRRR
jgi:hypothetical protein